MSHEHMTRLGNFLSDYNDKRILCLTRWIWGTKPENVTVCSLLDILKIEGVQDRIPYPDTSYDLVIAIDMLDRLLSPSNIVAEVYRVLKPGGTIYLEVPYLQPYDHVRGGYWRFTPEGVQVLLTSNKLIVEDFGIANGPGSTMHWISRIYHALQFDRDGSLDDLRSKAGDADYCEAYGIFGMDGEYLKATDDDLNSKEHAICIAASYYAVAVKQGCNTEDNRVEEMREEVTTMDTIKYGNVLEVSDIAQLRVPTDKDT